MGTEKRERRLTGKGKGSGRQRKGNSKGKRRKSDQETKGHERPDERRPSVGEVGVKRQRVDRDGEQTRDESLPSRTPDQQTLTCRCALPLFHNYKLKTALWLIRVRLFSTCPKTSAFEVQMVDPEQQLNLFSVEGEPLRHCGIRRDVKFQAADGSKMKENFEVTDANTTDPVSEEGC